MATLVSPGVSITTTDESFHVASVQVLSLIVIATAQDKKVPMTGLNSTYTILQMQIISTLLKENYYKIMVIPTLKQVVRILYMAENKMNMV